MGTIVEITVADRSEERARLAMTKAMGEFERIDALMSCYRQGSAVFKLNHTGPGEELAVGEEVFDLLQLAAEVSQSSGGAFDATIRPLSSLWDFDHGGVVPSRDDIENSTRYVGYEKLILNEKSKSVGFSSRNMGVDLGGIAKGWAVDRAMEELTRSGIRNAIIDAGGDLRVAGARPGRKFWRIGVQHPREQGALLMTFEMKDAAIVTSGDYERFFVAEGVRYHHILDPASGQPARGCQSVTVIAPTAAEADACSTAAFVLGPDRGLAFLKARPGVRGVIVDADGGMHWTDEALAAMAHR